ncbi:MAG: molybdate transport system ATP-binding protein [Lentisphaeria bacterium]|jgi:molybdate transport system ATP-binding protein
MIDVQLFGATGQHFSMALELSLPASGITVITGRSGSGKTTLLKFIAGLKDFSHPQNCCVVDGEVWHSSESVVPPHLRQLAYVFQHSALFPHLSVSQNIEFYKKGNRKGQSRIKLGELVEMLALEPLLSRSTHHLSGGEQKRVAIARALMSNPKVLLLDEPLSGLDQQSKHSVLSYLERVKKHTSIPMLYVTHDCDEIARMGDHMIVLDQGECSAQGSVLELVPRLDLFMSHTETASSVLEGDVVPSPLHEADFGLVAVAVGDDTFTLPQGMPNGGARQRLRIYARDVSIALTHHEDTSVTNILGAKIAQCETLDNNQMLVRLELKGGGVLLSRITARSWNLLGLSVGMRVYAQVKSIALL